MLQKIFGGKMKVSVFKDYFSPLGREHNLDWPTLAKCLTHFRPSKSKKQQKTWSPSIFRSPVNHLTNGSWSRDDIDTPQKRSKANSYEVSCLVFDYDDGQNISNYVLSIMEKTDWNFAFHTTSSATLQDQRWRLIFPLERPIDGFVWSEGVKEPALALWRMLGLLGTPDMGALVDAARIYSLPYQTAYTCSEMRTNGKNLDVSFNEQVFKEFEIVHTQRTVQKAKAYLRTYLTSIYKHPSHVCDKEYSKNLLVACTTSRRVVAERLNARIVGDKVTKWPCPDCGKTDATYYYLTAGTRAFCSHKNNCGWTGTVYELAKQWDVLP